jgi:ComEC/Rec2-related protein
VAYRRELSRVEGAFLLLTAAAFFAYGNVSITAARRDIERFLTAPPPSETEVTLEGWVCGFPHWRYAGAAFDFRTRVDGIEHTVLVQSKEFLVSYGDSLRLRGSWKAPGDLPAGRWTNRCLAIGVSGEFRALAGRVERLEGRGGGWLSRHVFFPCHDRARQELCRGLGSRSGLPIALLIGERGYIDRRVSQAFRTLGISHLLALSGLHLGFVAGAFVLLLRLLGRRVEAALLAILAVYVAIVGPIVSLYRAFVMAGVLIVASLLKRPLSPISALVRAFIVILLVQPHSFYSVAFQLSFMATLAVLLCVRTMRPPESRSIANRLVFWVRSSLRVSLAAQLFVAPLIIHYFGQLSLLSPLATLVFVVPVAFLLFLSAVAVFVAVASPAVASLVFAALDRVTTIFQGALVGSVLLVPGLLSPPGPNAWLYYGGLCLFVLARDKRRVKVAGVLVVCLSFAASLVR